MSGGMQGDIPKSMRDTLLIIHFGIDRSVGKTEVEQLITAGYIVPKHGGGWMTTSRGRDYVKALKR